LSEAFEAGLIRDAPANDEEFATLSERVLNQLALVRGTSVPGKVDAKQIRLRDYQITAVDKWLSNGAKGILEMATGTGKTVAALACVSHTYKNVQRLAVVVTVPYSHLVQQWKKEVHGFGLRPGREIIADSTNPSWKNEFADGMTDLGIGHTNNLLVYTTHNTFSSTDFAAILRRGRKGSHCFLIADEVHGTGAPKTQGGLLDCYRFRLGLSATPRRWFDDLGSKAIYDYFGDVVFEFTLRDAINTINPETGQTYLTPYKYCPRFVPMTGDELERYMGLTRSIVTRLGSGDDALRDELVRLLAFKRADIIKNADGKYDALENLLEELGDPIAGLIIYCSPEQIDNVMRIVNNRRITVHRFTMSEGSRPSTDYGGLSEREQILSRFASGEYQALVAMKCLDEGVDVPPATSAVIMASSGNPREYIQRIGRVIRHHPGKDLAVIHDLVVVPSVAALPVQLRSIEATIMAKEMRRYEEIAGMAVNNVSALRQIYSMREAMV
jgi:superfamily II DNA or RNA helicase